MDGAQKSSLLELWIQLFPISDFCSNLTFHATYFSQMIFVPFIVLASFLQFVHSGEQKKAKDILPEPAETGLKDANGLVLVQSLLREWNGNRRK